MALNDERAELDEIDSAVLTAAQSMPTLQRVAVCALWQRVYRLFSKIIDRIEQLEAKRQL